jgi:predicted homoserine dehydrogenase-like protein
MNRDNYSYDSGMKKIRIGMIGAGRRLTVVVQNMLEQAGGILRFWQFMTQIPRPL